MHNLRGSKITAKRPDSHNASFCDASAKNNARALAMVGVTGKSISNTYTDTNNQSISKYDLPLCFRDKKLDYTNIMASCPTLQLWGKQNAHKFGFIPLSELDVPPTLSPSNVSIP